MNYINNRKFQYIIAILIPLIGCVLHLIIDHIAPINVSIVSSSWNDELMYYKQIEGMVKYSIPKGYFGFNESTSILGHFAAWSPILLMPYTIVGKVFTWNQWTPIIFNIICWELAFVFYVKVRKPNYSQIIFVGLSWIAFESIIRYTFSTTPESYIGALLFVLLLCIVSYIERQTLNYLLIANVILVLLTLMRGYYAVYFLFFLYYFWTKHKNKYLVSQIMIALVAVVLYMMILHYFTAEYLDSIINMQFSVKHTIKLILIGAKESIIYIIQSILGNSMRGSWYLIFLISLLCSVKIFKTNKLLCIPLIASMIILLLAMWVLYNPKEGSRQLLAVALATILLNMSVNTKDNIDRRIAILTILAIAGLTWFSKDSFYNKLPVDDSGFYTKVCDAQTELSEKIVLSDEPWDNTAIWSLSAKHNDMYILPIGCGISCCYEDYIIENIENIKSKYILVDLNGKADNILNEKGYECIYIFDETKIYQIR